MQRDYGIIFDQANGILISLYALERFGYCLYCLMFDKPSEGSYLERFASSIVGG